MCPSEKRNRQCLGCKLAFDNAITVICPLWHRTTKVQNMNLMIQTLLVQFEILNCLPRNVRQIGGKTARLTNTILVFNKVFMHLQREFCDLYVKMGKFMLRNSIWQCQTAFAKQCRFASLKKEKQKHKTCQFDERNMRFDILKVSSMESILPILRIFMLFWQNARTKFSNSNFALNVKIRRLFHFNWLSINQRLVDCFGVRWTQKTKNVFTGPFATWWETKFRT